MNRRLAIIIAIVIVTGWLVNLVAVDPKRELYPLTSWPMFSSSKSTDVSRVYKFRIWDAQGNGPRELSLDSMILPKRKANGKFTSRYIKAFEQQATSSDWSNLVTSEVAKVWRQNAMHYLKLDGPPRKVQFVRLEFDLARPSSTLDVPFRESILAEIVAQKIELANLKPGHGRQLE